MGRGRGRGGDDEMYFCAGGCCCCLFIAGTIMFACSWDTIEPTEYGLKYNTFSKDIEDHVYEEGRWFVGLAREFIIFPKNYQVIEYSHNVTATDMRRTPAAPINVRSQDGLSVVVEVSFQYQLRENGIFKLYRNYRENYETVFITQCKDVLMQVGSNYDAKDYWSKRVEIGDMMQSELSIQMDKLYADTKMFQLLHVTVPYNYEQVITQTQVKQQEVIKKEYEQQVSLIFSSIDVIEAQANASIVSINATAHARATYTMLKAKAQATANNIRIQGISYNVICKEFGNSKLGPIIAKPSEFYSIHLSDDDDESMIFAPPDVNGSNVSNSTLVPVVVPENATNMTICTDPSELMEYVYLEALRTALHEANLIVGVKTASVWLSGSA